MRLPQVTGQRLIRALKGAGFIERGARGSHRVLVHPTDPRRRAVIPVHGARPVKPGTLLSILQGLGLTVEELRELL